MSKYLKSLITACLVVCMTVCVGIFAAACTDNGGDGEGAFPSSVNVTVKLGDDTPAVGLAVQLCAVRDDGSLGTCLTPELTNEQGVATIKVNETHGKIYEVHFTNDIPEGYKYVDANGNDYADVVVETGKTGKGIQFDVTKNSSLTITLKAVA